MKLVATWINEVLLLREMAFVKGCLIKLQEFIKGGKKKKKKRWTKEFCFCYRFLGFLKGIQEAPLSNAERWGLCTGRRLSKRNQKGTIKILFVY